ncbi:MAG: F0F1 ATP synthase subunit A, partial [Pseudomonadota bacterium]
MDQFEVKSLFGGEIGMFTITNVTLWMALAVVAIALMLVVGTRGRAVVPS